MRATSDFAASSSFAATGAAARASRGRAAVMAIAAAIFTNSRRFNIASKYGVCRRASVGAAVFVGEAHLAVDHRHGEIVIGIDHNLARRAVADFEINHLARTAIHELVRVPAAGAETGAVAGLHRGFAGIGDQYRLALDDIDELVLLGVMMADRRHRARRQMCQIDAEILETERLA